MATILREFVHLNYDRKVIQEAINAQQPLYLTSVLQRADAVNQNKRVYPRPVLEREVENYKKAVAEGRATGELDHPDSSVISLKNVSHIVREIWWNGGDVMGKIEILDTSAGQEAKKLLAAGVRVGMSSRGVGETRKNEQGYDEVDESYMLIGFDLVSEPSTHGAWLHESKQIDISDIRKMINKADRINRIANEILRAK
jgi:hypothetical protein